MTDEEEFSARSQLKWTRDVSSPTSFFWKMVRPYIGDALRYLQISQEGKQWASNLYANVFSMEHRGQTPGP